MAVMTHAQIDSRSLEAHRLIAEPSLRTTALDNIRRWLGCPSGSEHYLLLWKALLEGNLADLLAVMRMRSDCEQATALRQSTPFAGSAFTTQAERLHLIQKYAAL
jgi:hypothetical protein